MIIYEFIDPKKIRRAALYAACIVVMLTLQENVLARVSVFGVRASPMPALIAAIGLFEGGLWGGLFGVFAGFFSDMAGANTRVLLTIILAAMGFLSGLVGQLLINRRFYSYMVAAAVILLAASLCQALPVWVYHRASPLALLRTAALQALWSVPFAVPCYFACRAIAGQKFKE
ncbi:MAG: hypothetical protein NC319_04255 [Butyricicoccus sp.]|nr:hypothetical protein [Butyricicoccus sp.]